MLKTLVEADGDICTGMYRPDGRKISPDTGVK